MFKTALGVLLLSLTWAICAQEVGEHIRIGAPVEHDLYAAGRSFELRSSVKGDAVVAAQSIRIGGPVTEDLIAAGEQVEVGAAIGDDVRAAGRRVEVRAGVADHLIAAGETVTIAREARIGSFAWIAGREVIIDGEIGGMLRLFAESASIAGHVAGDAEIHAQKIELLPGARIDGNLTWSGEEPRVANDARVGGRVIGQPSPQRTRPHPPSGTWVALFLIAAFAVAGVVLFLLFPHVASRTAAEIRHKPGLVALLGFVVLVVTPVAAVLFFVTGVGWLLGLLLLLLYLAALATSGLVGAYAVSDMALAAAHKESAGKALRVAVLVAIIALVGVMQGFPLLGGLLSLVLMVWGLGAIAQLLFSAGADRSMVSPHT